MRSWRLVWGTRQHARSFLSSDFVLEPDYDLMPLGELEAYIKEHKHLPNVQSAEQMTEDGIKLTEFSMLLLEKLEELTLYTPPSAEDQR